MNSTIRDAQAQLERVQAEIAARTRELSSGRRLNSISDDPLATRGAIVQRAEVAKLDSYTKATDSVDSRLSVTDSILSDVIVQITAALTAAAGSRGSHVSPAQHEAYAIQLEGIRDTILADVNTQFNGTYLFSGGAATTEPYTKTGGVVSAYQGTATVVSVDVSESLAVQVSRNGDALLRGADANDLFVEFDLLITAVRAGDAVGIDAGIAALNRAIDRATAAVLPARHPCRPRTTWSPSLIRVIGALLGFFSGPTPRARPRAHALQPTWSLHPADGGVSPLSTVIPGGGRPSEDGVGRNADTRSRVGGPCLHSLNRISCRSSKRHRRRQSPFDRPSDLGPRRWSGGRTPAAAMLSSSLVGARSTAGGILERRRSGPPRPSRTSGSWLPVSVPAISSRRSSVAASRLSRWSSHPRRFSLRPCARAISRRFLLMCPSF